MDTVSRSDLNKAADAFFAKLSLHVNAPRAFDAIYREEAIAMNVEASRGRSDGLRDQFIDGSFDDKVRASAI